MDLTSFFFQDVLLSIKNCGQKTLRCVVALRKGKYNILRKLMRRKASSCTVVMCKKYQSNKNNNGFDLLQDVCIVSFEIVATIKKTFRCFAALKGKIIY